MTNGRRTRGMPRLPLACLLLSLGAAAGTVACGASAPPPAATPAAKGYPAAAPPPSTAAQPAADSEASATTAPAAPMSSAGAPPAPPPLPSPAPSESTPEEAPSMAGQVFADLKKAEHEIAAGDCPTACRALGSMERAVVFLCAANSSTEDSDRCANARRHLLTARRRIRTTCGACAGGPSVEPDAPIPSTGR
jgi:hypothetical protein